MKLVCMLVVLISCLSTIVYAAESEVYVDIISAYDWRGIILNDESVLQPAITTSSSNGLSFTAWGNMNLTDSQGIDQRNEFNEINLIAAYLLPIDVVNIELGIIEYLYPSVVDAEGTREAYASVGTDKIPLNPKLTVYRDIDEANGWYGVASISDSRDLTDKLSLDIELSVGAGDSVYNEYNFETDATKFNDGSALVTLTQQLNDSLSLAVYGGYSRLLDSAIRDSANELYFNHDDNVYGGTTLSYTF
jgi:hypothetical protein